MTAAPVRVHDCFPYLTEAWAVAARLHLWSTLAPQVDYRPVAFVGDRTHRGEPKPLPPAEDLVGVEQVFVPLTAPDDWGREEQQRDAVVDYVRENAKPDDLVLLCDADEIVDPRRLDVILAATEAGPVKLWMPLWMCGTRWRNRQWWRHPGACRARDLPEHPSQQLRLGGGLAGVPGAGWHLSYYGTDADVDAKLKAFAHAEVDTADNRASLAALREHGDAERVDEPLVGPLADFLAGWSR